MRVTLVTIGSRGDAEPYVALGCALSRAGHAVRVATCEPFRDLVTSQGLEFFSLGGDIKAIVGDEGRAALSAAGTNPVRVCRALRRYVGPLVEEAHGGLEAAIAGSEVVIGHLLVPGAEACASRRGMLYLDASYVPTLPTRAFAHPGAPPGTPPGLASLTTHLAAEQVFWQAFRPCVDAFRARALGLGRSPLLGPPMFRLDRRPPMLFAFSPEIVPPPSDWPQHAFVQGYWFLDPPSGWAPPERLVQFLNGGEPPVYIGFGSMTVPRPEELTRAVIEGVRKAGRRAILGTGWGTITAGSDSEDILFVGDVPHGWLFERVSGAIHHGGTGTTAQAFRAGIPQMAVPFLADQPFWGHRIWKLGVGPAAVPIATFDSEQLRRGLAHMELPAVRSAAREMGHRIRAERGAERTVEVIARLAGQRRASLS